MSKFTAHRIEPLFAFIGTGDKIAMYTLRVMNQYTSTYQGEQVTFVDSEYVRNLSTNKAKAETLASEFADHNNLEFRGNAEFELNEIRRNRDEQNAIVAEARRLHLAKVEQDARDDYERVLNDGVFLSGKYKGLTPGQVFEVEPGYVFWFAKQSDSNKSLYTIDADLAAKFIADYNPQKPGHFGNIGDEVVIEVRFAKVSYFPNRFGGTSSVVTFYDSENRMITCFTTSKKLTDNEVGTKLKISGVISEHGEYNDMPQTLIKKPKIVK